MTIPSSLRIVIKLRINMVNDQRTETRTIDSEDTG